jgi:hypothetical protein
LTDPPSNHDKDNSTEGVSQSAIPADVGEVKADETIHEQNQSQSAQRETNRPTNPWIGRRILNLLSKWWDDLKETANTNRAIAVATIVIAIATAVTLAVIWTGSGDTQRAADAAQSFSDTAKLIRTDLQNAVADNKQAFSDNNKAIRDTLAENRNELSKALDQNRRSLEASIAQSKAALDTSIAASRLEQRAWVAPLGISNISFKVGEPIAFSIVFQNSGKSPALHETHEIAARSFPKGGKVDFTYTPPLGIRSSTTIQPGMNITNSSPPDTLRPTQGQIDAIKSGDAVLYLYGKISYDDVFSIQHHTTFCFVVNPDLTSAEWYTEYNEAD